MTYITGTGTTSPQVVVALSNGRGARTLGPASTAILAPNGKLVAAVTLDSSTGSAGSSLVLYHASGSTGPQTLRQSAGELTLLAWSPDSRLIALVDGSSLVIINVASGNARTLVTGTFDGASFKPVMPGHTERIAYALASSLLATATVNLYAQNANGAGTAAQLTSDGHSDEPLWGPNGILFARSAVVSGQATPAEVWLIHPGGASRQLTNLAIAPPLTGLTPVAVSSNGEHVIANLVGTNSAEVWTINIQGRRATTAELGGNAMPTLGTAVSRDGTTILLTSGYGTPSALSIESEPWSGGATNVLAQHGAYASWNR
jgi:Tol biopolymer transport system component